MTAPRLVVLPWNGEHHRGRVEDGIPTFGFRDAPTGLATRRQLRAMGRCPGRARQDWPAQLKWARGKRWAALYLVDQSQPSPGATSAQLISLEKANRVLRTCADCGQVVSYRLPRSNGRVCHDCETGGEAA